jgi:hypothetical protein
LGEGEEAEEGGEEGCHGGGSFSRAVRVVDVEGMTEG